MLKITTCIKYWTHHRHQKYMCLHVFSETFHCRTWILNVKLDCSFIVFFSDCYTWYAVLTSVTLDTGMYIRAKHIAAVCYELGQYSDCLLVIPRILPCLLVIPRILLSLLVIPRILPSLLVIPRNLPSLLVIPRILHSLLVIPRILPCLLVIPRILPSLLVIPRILPSLTGVCNKSPLVVSSNISLRVIWRFYTSYHAAHITE